MAKRRKRKGCKFSKIQRWLDEKVARFLSWHLTMARRRKEKAASFFHKPWSQLIQNAQKNPNSYTSRGYMANCHITTGDNFAQMTRFKPVGSNKGLQILMLQCAFVG